MRRLYRILLRLYPPGFREEYGRDIEQQFSDEYRDAHTRRERISLGLRALTDVAATAPGEIARETGQDLRFAARVYRRRVVATALAISALALAIGATTGIFSVLNALLIRGLPFRDPEQLVDLRGWSRAALDRNAVNAWRTSSQYLQDAARYSTQPMNLGIRTESFRVTVSETSSNFLRLLGADPEIGRGFSDDEDIPGRNRVAVIGYGLWQQAFGGDPGAIGATIRLNGTPLTIIGVAPRNFDFPENTAVWTPTAYGYLPGLYWMTQTIGRLKPGLSFQRASAMYLADAGQVKEGWPKPQLERLRDQLAGPVRPASLVLISMMLFVLLIACANLAYLLLSRVADRRQELAIRTSLGASRARLTRQLITEATLLTGAAAIAGLAVAQWTARLAGIAQPAQLAARPYSVLDWRVVAFALSVAAITGVLFGVLPASLISRTQPVHSRMRMLLVGLQAALTVILAAGSFGMGRTFLKLLNIDLGYRTNRVVTMSISLTGTAGRTAPFCRRALETLRAVPGVESAAAASYLPLVPSRIQEGTFFKLDTAEHARSARVMLVTPDYFRTMGTPLVEGREFTAADWRRAPPVVIVTEEFTRMYPGRRLVGRTMHLDPANIDAIIVGVVRSHRFLGPESDPWPAIYRPMDQYEQWFATFVAKVHGAPEQYLARCRDAVQSTDRSVPVFDVKTLDQRRADAVARPRFYTTAIVFLAGFALLLAATGAYGVASHMVAQRKHEIGIRLAIGGPPGRVRAMVFLESMIPVFAGVVVGLAGSAGSGRFLKHLIASAPPTGIPMAADAAAAVALATACAIWIGTRRVIRTDPVAALRVE